MNFDQFQFHPSLAQGIADRRFVTPTPVQARAIPAVLAGRDLLASAATGTGKTAAFVLPILQRLLSAPKEGTRALILAPTRELAIQIEDDIEGLGYHTGITSAAVYGGVGMSSQERALRGGVNIVVATPGRLLDHMRDKTARFDCLEILVLDEADRMLDMGFWPDVRRIVSALPRERQTLLFSATLADEVKSFARQMMRTPEVIEVGARRKPAPKITHKVYRMPRHEKPAWLSGFLRKSRGATVLVFVRTKRGADRLARTLGASGARVSALHGDRTQAQRTAVMEGFRSGRCRVLVATDIAARGLDVDHITHVINFDVPATRDDYVHRVGRTGRADASGEAVTLVAPEEAGILKDLERAFGDALSAS